MPCELGEPRLGGAVWLQGASCGCVGTEYPLGLARRLGSRVIRARSWAAPISQVPSSVRLPRTLGSACRVTVLCAQDVFRGEGTRMTTVCMLIHRRGL